MKINIVSDLHLDISGCIDMSGGDVLIVAGDACEAKSLRSNAAAKDFFHTQCLKYNRVFYVIGNHEYYHNRTWKTVAGMRESLPSNVVLLDDASEEYNGVRFVGATLWTDCNHGNPLDRLSLKQGMMDYRVITHKHSGGYGKLRPMDTEVIHKKSLKFIQEQLNTDLPVIVITHHAPSYHSIPQQYKMSTLNAGYASSLEDLILDNPSIKHWIHGHIHEHQQYQIGDTWVHCNPRGYLPYENTGFDINYSIEI